jgi:putative flippase GtrA
MAVWLRSLGKHQTAALIATVVDFAVMIALVEGHVLSAAPATALGASSGAVTNFVLGRRWIFPDSASARMRGQAFRYAIVSAASLGLNTVGVFLLTRPSGAPYIVARVATAVAVSLLWNFPLHRRFVFRTEV